jgi:thioredoxin 1
MPGKVHELHSVDNFNTILSNNSMIIIDFYAKWCGPCKSISPKIDELSVQSKYQNIYFAKVDVDNVPDLANNYNVQSLPTFMAFKNGKFLGETKGANYDNIVKLVNALL